jgi:hypothetical protein
LGWSRLTYSMYDLNFISDHRPDLIAY